MNQSMTKNSISTNSIGGGAVDQRNICDNTKMDDHHQHQNNNNNNKSKEMDANNHQDQFCDDDTILNGLDTQLFGEFPQFDYMELRTDPQYKGFNNIVGKSWIYPTNFPIRQYQYNISRVCLFKNTLVVLPTGLGKTFIAAVVMYNMYRWYPLGKVIFMAPTRPLVTQQIEACYRIMGITKDDTAELTGKINKTLRRNLWQTKRVFFVTPQIVVSDLNDPEIAFPIDAIKLIVVDEAHRAKGKYAYTEVIQQIYSRNKMFRILALSATPGRRLEDVAEVLQNLLISHIEVRCETSIDVMQYTHKKNMKTIVVKMDQRLLDIRKDFLNVIDPYVKILLEFNVISSNTHNLNKGWLLLELKRFRENSFVQRHPHQTTIQSTFSTCISLYHALELLDRHGVRVFLNFFEDYSNSTEEKYFVAKDGYLKGLLNSIRLTIKDRDLFLMNDSTINQNNNNNNIADTSRNESITLNGNNSSNNNNNNNNNTTTTLNESIDFGHPKFEILRKNVLEHFQLNPSSRIIIFCEFRESVLLIHKLLLQNRPLIKAKIFIGQGSTTAGMRPVTQKQQIQIMNDFRLGTINTLIATCVAEEGIDVGEVDLIICFDINTKNPTRFVQRIGRTGRKRQGKVIMLATEGKEYDTLKEVLATKDKTNQKLSKSTEILRVLYKFSPRLVPPEFDPICVETPMEIPVENIETTAKKQPANKKATKRKLSKKDIAIIGNENENVIDEEIQVDKKKSKTKNNKTPKGMRNVGSYFKPIAMNLNDIDEKDLNVFCTAKNESNHQELEITAAVDGDDGDVINKLIKKLNRTRLKYLNTNSRNKNENKIPAKNGKIKKKIPIRKQSINEIDIIFNAHYLTEWKQFIILKNPMEFKKHYENKENIKISNQIDQIFEFDRKALENNVLNINNADMELISERCCIPPKPKQNFSKILDDLENFIVDDNDNDEDNNNNNSEACLRILNEPFEYLLNIEQNSMDPDDEGDRDIRKKLEYDQDCDDVQTPNIFFVDNFTPIDYEIKSEYNNQIDQNRNQSPLPSDWNSNKLNENINPFASTPIKKVDNRITGSQNKSLSNGNKLKSTPSPTSVSSPSPIRNNPIANLFAKWENKKNPSKINLDPSTATSNHNPLLNYFLLKSIDDLFYCNRKSSIGDDNKTITNKKDFNQSITNKKDLNQSIANKNNPNQSISNKQGFNQSVKNNIMPNESLKKSLNLFNDSFHNTCNELFTDIKNKSTKKHESTMKNNESNDLFSDNSLFKNSIINMVIDDNTIDYDGVDKKKLNKTTIQNADRSVTVTQIMKILDEGDRIKQMQEKQQQQEQPNKYESINIDKQMNQSSMFGDSNSMTKQIDIIDDINDLFNSDSGSSDIDHNNDDNFVDLTIDNGIFEEIKEQLPPVVDEDHIDEEDEEDFIESSQPIQDRKNIILKKITRQSNLDIHCDKNINNNNNNDLLNMEEINKIDSQKIPIISLPSSSSSTSSTTLSNQLNTAFTNFPLSLDEHFDIDNVNDSIKQNTQLLPSSSSSRPSHLTPPPSSFKSPTRDATTTTNNIINNNNEYPSPSLLFKRNINFSRLKLYEGAAKISPDIINDLSIAEENIHKNTIILEQDDNRNESQNDTPTKSSSLDDSIIMVGIPRNRKRIIKSSESSESSSVSSSDSERKSKSNNMKTNQPFRKSRKRLKHLFIDDEAQGSQGDSQGDDEEETNGMQLSNLICNTIVEHDPNVDMQAKYLQSVRSPQKHHGGFRIPDAKRYANNIDVFSQAINQTVGEYIKDSFVVHSSDTESENDGNIGNCNNAELSPLQKAEIILAQKRKQKRTLKKYSGNSFKRRRKIILINTSSSSDEDK